MKTYTVKPLEWRDWDDGGLTASGVMGIFIIHRLDKPAKGVKTCRNWSWKQERAACTLNCTRVFRYRSQAVKHAEKHHLESLKRFLNEVKP